jgi:Na+-transporting methylmalonyl-CoA/oxaloacetate decarboxylase gamma subunit
MNITSILLTDVQGLGLTIAVVGFGIVIIALSVLVLVFLYAPKLMKIRRPCRRSKDDCRDGEEEEVQLEGNVNAAIALAIHMYLNEAHDEESNIVTIKRVRRSYSPWSSKIYGVYDRWAR